MIHDLAVTLQTHAAEEFEFDRREKISKAELQALMVAEMAHFRPGFGIEGGRPKSTRLAAHSLAAAKSIAEAKTAAAVKPPVQTSNGKGSSSTSSALVSPGHSYAAAVATAKQQAPTADASTVLKKQRELLSHHSVSAREAFEPTPPPVPPKPTPATAPLVRSNSEGSKPAIAVSTASAPAALTTAQILNEALIEQIRAIRTDVLTALDKKLDDFVVRQLNPAIQRIDRLEASVAALQKSHSHK